MPHKFNHQADLPTDQISDHIDEAILKIVDARDSILLIGDNELNLLADMILFRIGQIEARRLADFDIPAAERRAA